VSRSESLSDVVSSWMTSLEIHPGGSSVKPRKGSAKNVGEILRLLKEEWNERIEG
jgi:hypothetical protein